MEKRAYFNREVTNAVKGIALIFMFIHHFFTFPNAYVEGISYPSLRPFAAFFRQPFKMCVPVFAFLTGYLYFFCKTKTLRYSARKATDVLVNYQIVYLLFLALSLVLDLHTLSPKSFALEFFSLRTTIMNFCWYVSFYILSMLLLPVLAALPSGGVIRSILIWILLPYACFTGLLYFIENTTARGILANLSVYFPCIAIGYICARYSVFEKISTLIAARLQSKSLRVVLWLLLAVASFLARHFIKPVALEHLPIVGSIPATPVGTDILLAPVFILSVVNLILSFPWNPCFALLAKIGKHSMSMWFLHCLFFSSVTKGVFQPFLYLPRNPLLVLIWGTGLCLLAAMMLDKPTRRILALKNKLFS